MGQPWGSHRAGRCLTCTQRLGCGCSPSNSWGPCGQKRCLISDTCVPPGPLASHGAPLTCPTGCCRPGRAWQGPAGSGCQQGTSSAGRSQGAEREQVSACSPACRTSRLRAHRRSQALASVVAPGEGCHPRAVSPWGPPVSWPPLHPSPPQPCSVGTMGEGAQGGPRRILGLWPDLERGERKEQKDLGCLGCACDPAGPHRTLEEVTGCPEPLCFGSSPVTPAVPSGYPPAGRGRAAPHWPAGCSSWGRSATGNQMWVTPWEIAPRQGHPAWGDPPPGNPLPAACL